MKNIKVLIVGDSRKMKGGVSTVIKTMETSSLWDKYSYRWIECQVNSNKVAKILYLLRGFLISLFVMPKYDIVHFMTTPGSGMVVQLPMFLYSLLLRKKKVLHLHVGNQLKDYNENKVFRFCVKHSDLVLTLGGSWCEYVPVPEKWNGRVDYLYNPSPIPIEQKAWKKYFLFAAWFDLNKGYDILLKGFAKVVKKYPEWRLVMCGVGNEDEVLQFIKENGIEDNVDMPGWVEGEEKERYFKEAYAYCMTSLKEGLPMTVLESMAYGVPVISTPVGCLPEFIEDHKNGMLFDFKDADGLAKAMLELIEKQDLRADIARNASKTIADKFQLEVYVRRLDDFYSTL